MAVCLEVWWQSCSSLRAEEPVVVKQEPVPVKAVVPLSLSLRALLLVNLRLRGRYPINAAGRLSVHPKHCLHPLRIHIAI